VRLINTGVDDDELTTDQRDMTFLVHVFNSLTWCRYWLHAHTGTEPVTAWHCSIKSHNQGFEYFWHGCQRNDEQDRAWPAPGSEDWLPLSRLPSV
jgi:hypothetical protein